MGCIPVALMLAGLAQDAERVNSAVREQHSEATLLASPLQANCPGVTIESFDDSSGAIKASRD